jgi:DNA-binding CsgD family transcriptional regulator
VIDTPMPTVIDLELARRILTPKQYDVLVMHLRGASMREIHIHCEVSEPRARRILTRSIQKIAIELRKDAA